MLAQLRKKQNQNVHTHNSADENSNTAVDQNTAKFHAVKYKEISKWYEGMKDPRQCSNIIIIIISIIIITTLLLLSPLTSGGLSNVGFAGLPHCHAAAVRNQASGFDDKVHL